MPLFYSFIYLQVADVDFCINGTEFKFYVKPYFLGELETPSISNWNLEMPFFEETRKLGYMEKKSLQTEITSQKLTASLAWVWHRLRDVNPGHIGGRQFYTQSVLAFWSVIWPCSYPADQEARRLWDRYKTGREMIDLITSSALLNTPGTAELVGKETGKPPPPLPFHNVLSLMHGQETI